MDCRSAPSRAGDASRSTAAGWGHHERRWRLTDALRCHGYEAVTVRSSDALLSFLGTSLLRRGRGPKVDLLIIDENIPGTHGLDALLGLRRAGWEVPVVLLCEAQSATTLARAKRLGVLAVFDKRVGIADVVDFVESWNPA